MNLRRIFLRDDAEPEDFWLEAKWALGLGAAAYLLLVLVMGWPNA